MESRNGLFLLSAVLTFFPSCYGLYCTEIYSKYNDWHQQSCYCDSNASSTLTSNSSWLAQYRQSLNRSLSFVVDKVTGVGVVSFELPEQRCAFSEYSVELRLLNASDEDSCLQANFAILEDVNNSDDDTDEVSFGETQYKEHSNQEFLTHASNNSDPACHKHAELKFFYIFTGCYYVVVTPQVKKRNTRQIESKYQYIVSDVKQKDLEILGKDVPKVFAHYSPLTGSLVPRFLLGLPAGSTAKTGPMLVALQLKSDVDASQNFSCTSSGREHDCCVMRENSNKGVCRSDPKIETHSCSFMNDTIQCTFNNVIPGNYCAVISLQDARCEPSSLWFVADSLFTTCVWTHSFEVKASGGKLVVDQPHPTSRWPIWIVLGLVVTVIFIALMYGLFVLLTIARRGQLAESNMAVLTELVNVTDESPLINGQGQKLLLLYARDCDAFMDLMYTLRGLLQKYCKCEVLDCYDEANQQEIFTREHDWILGHMNHVPMTDLKVVLVATECSAAHQLAQCGARKSVVYRDPDPCDKIFPLALKLLKEDVNPGLYTRINLVEFSGFKIINESPTLFPNPFTRFVLPTSFKELVCSIRGLANNNLLNTCDDDLKKLNSELDDLLQYKKDNPSYLQTIIS